MAVKPRELRGAINRCKTVYVFVYFADDGDVESPPAAEDNLAEASDKGGTYLQVPKSTAKAICEAAEEDGTESINAEEDGNDVYIG